MHLSVFTQCSPSPQFKGMWRHPRDRSATGYRSLRYWTSLARQLEDACLDALFIGDMHGVYDVYQGSWAAAVRHAVQVPAIDPALIVPAAAAATRHLGFAVTYATTYHQPYQCARLFSSLDHLSGGRVGWNITSPQTRADAHNGLGGAIPHDARHDRAEEYLTLVRALWEQSWQDGAVVRDAPRDVFTEPARVRQIDHSGAWFTVRGPHQCEPSAQRTPVLFQAVASPRAAAFAGRHAEVAVLTLADPRRGAAKVRQLREAARQAGRGAAAVRVLQGSMVMVAADRGEARARASLYRQLASGEGQLAKWCGWMEVDLAGYPDDLPVETLRGRASSSFLDFLDRLGGGHAWSVGEVRYLAARPRRIHPDAPMLLFGTAEQVADRMEQWLTVAGVDGFNLVPCPPSAGIEDICQVLVPELQRRGLFRTAYDTAEQTLRERYFGAGNRRYDQAAARNGG